MSRPKILIIGLDGANLALVEKFSASGRMPNVRKLMERGVRGNLTSVVPPITGPAWSSFMTGVNPGRHGVFDWWKRMEGEYTLAPVNSLMLRYFTFWEILSGEGRRVCAVNIPVTYPPIPVNGCMISGLGTPEHIRSASFPPEAGRELLDRVPEYKVVLEDLYSSANPIILKKGLLDMVRARTEGSLFLLEKEDWDVFMTVYMATDMVHHRFWHYYDPDHPRYDPNMPASLQKAVADVYSAVDRGVGEIIKAAGPGVDVILMSDHGAGALHKFIFLNNWLAQNGYLVFRRNIVSRLKKMLFYNGVTPINVFSALEKMGLSRFLSKISRHSAYKLAHRFFLSSRDIDWKETKAYSVGNIGQIYLNVKGREPEGFLEGESYERIREEIAAGLKKIMDPDSGMTVMEYVYKKEEIYSGELLSEAPDILMLPRGLTTMAAGFTEFMSRTIIEDAAAFSGAHRMEGLFIGCGKNFLHKDKPVSASLLDLMPTILALAGFYPPDYCDGRVLQEILKPLPQGKKIKPISEDWGSRKGKKGEGYSREESEEISKKLKSLGYI